MYGMMKLSSAQKRPPNPEPELMNNPEYGGWVAFGAGAWVRLHETLEAAGSRIESEVLCRLMDLTSSRAVVERVENRLGADGVRTEVRRENVYIPARIPTENVLENPEVARVREGVEEVEIGRKKVPCPWIETLRLQGNGVIRTRTWRSPEVPGGLARVETRTRGGTKAVRNLHVLEWRGE